MGSYLSRDRSRPPSPAVLDAAPPERPERVRPPHPTCRGHSAAPDLVLARRLSYEDLVDSPQRRWYPRWLVTDYREQYPSQQAGCFPSGVFSPGPQRSHQKPVMPACSSRMFCTSVIPKMASARGKLTPGVGICTCPSGSGHLPAPCVKGTLMRALEEGGEPRAKEDQDRTAIDSREELAKRKEGRPAPGRQDAQRSGSAFRRLMVNGALSSFVPRPGPLKTDLGSKNSGDGLTKKSQTRFLSSCNKRNAIVSSYSSTGGFPLPQRGAPDAAAPRGQASSSPNVSSKSAPEEGLQPSAPASLEPQTTIKHDKAAKTTSGQKQSLRNCSPPSDTSRPQKRKIPLLRCRRNDPLNLPLAAWTGYRVTAEDLDLEKIAVIQGINKVFEG
ncbi:nuclear envelope pore membrane protein POM 121-like [Manis pentadactyla]|uniref:nuclear envelope pore membrane protein POM 121-like n=1 Tax=Manis pentadactyla TaxID=143292 RepID=UPI00255CF3DB|nr:nuclear envelope pore membrane protein POM 121-like [Manis pentadactyla]